MLACGAAFIAIGLWPSTVLVTLLLALTGAGRVLIDVGCRTLLQRTTPPEVLGRVFGVLEGVMMAGLAAGALTVPALVELGGPKAALIGAGLLLPCLGALIARRLIGIDRAAKVPIVEIALLRSMPLFALLPAPVIEGLARAVAPVDVPAGMVVMHLGEEGDLFYAIAEGEVEVSRDGIAVARLGRGEASARSRCSRTAAHRDRHGPHRRAPLRAREGRVRGSRDRPRAGGPRGAHAHHEAARRARGALGARLSRA